jgi:hypothetical protein
MLSGDLKARRASGSSRFQPVTRRQPRWFENVPLEAQSILLHAILFRRTETREYGSVLAAVRAELDELLDAYKPDDRSVCLPQPSALRRDRSHR